MFVFSFYVPHLAYTFAMSRKLVVRSVSFPLQRNEFQPLNTAFLVGSNFSLYFSSVLLLVV